MTSPSASTIIDNPDRHESYLLETIIGKGSRSTVYRATCTRGRLNGRKVAIKAFILNHPDIVEETCATTAIRSLHHPALVSVHACFKDSSFYYIILELCEGGNICELINLATQSRSGQRRLCPLTEAQSRPIIRRVVEGLAHLHAHDVVHGEVLPHNIFVTSDGRIKLGGHGQLKTKVKPPKAFHGMLCQMSNYIAPEVATNGVFSFASDLWSLGCLIATILIGTCPFETEDSMDMRGMKLNVPYRFPKLSQHAQDVITSLLMIDPQLRMPLKSVLSHDFLDPSLPTETLTTALSYFKDRNARSERSQGVKRDFTKSQEVGLARYLKDEITKGNTSTRLPYCIPSMATPVSTTAINPPPRPRLYSTSSGLASSGISNSWGRSSSRRQCDEGSSHRTGSLGVAEATGQKPEETTTVRKAMGDVSNLGRPFRKPVASGGVCVETIPGDDHGTRGHFMQPSGLLSPPETHPSPILLHEGGPCDASSIASSPSTSSPERRTWQQGWHYRSKNPLIPVPSLPPYVYPIPIPRTSPPKALQVAPLVPQTHKTAHGQLVILPSRYLMVDLREGDRRAGGRGDRIICVSPEGQEIKVYEAPHLSTPCILSEPRETWILDELPERYWENYTFASKYLESVKKRTPWMAWYTPQAKFTVMSNGPKGDIHVSFPCPPHGLKEKHYVSGKLAESYIEMKIKFSRQQDTLGLSRYALSSKQRGRGEWITKSETITEAQLKLGTAFNSSLTAEERQGLVCLIEGLKLAEAAEDIYMVARPHIEEKGSSTLDNIPDRLLQSDASRSANGMTPQEPEASPISDKRPTPNLARSEQLLRH